MFVCVSINAVGITCLHGWSLHFALFFFGGTCTLVAVGFFESGSCFFHHRLSIRWGTQRTCIRGCLRQPWARLPTRACRYLRFSLTFRLLLVWPELLLQLFDFLFNTFLFCFLQRHAPCFAFSLYISMLLSILKLVYAVLYVLCMHIDKESSESCLWTKVALTCFHSCAFSFCSKKESKWSSWFDCTSCTCS